MDALINLFYLFTFGCVGSLLHAGFLQLRRAGLLFVVVCRLLIAVASLVAEHRLQVHGLQQLWHTGSVVVARGLWSAGSVVVAHGLNFSTACGIFLDQGLNACPLLGRRILNTAPPGKPQNGCTQISRHSTLEEECVLTALSIEICVVKHVFLCLLIRLTEILFYFVQSFFVTLVTSPLIQIVFILT